MPRKFYNQALDTVTVADPAGFMRYGSLHHIVGPYKVQHATQGGFEVVGKVAGSHTYGGILVKRALNLRTADDRINLTFRTKRDATEAMNFLLVKQPAE